MNFTAGTGLVSSIKRLLKNGTTPPRPEPSPRASITPIAEEVILPSGLNEEQAAALLPNLPLPEREIASFVLDTGLGTTETFSLKWTDLVLVDGAWWIRVGHRTVPLTDAARAIVQQQFQQRKIHPLIFDPEIKKMINKTLDEAGSKVGVEDVRMKILRATFARRLYLRGASLSRVRGLLGFKTATLRVVPSTPAQLRDAIDMLEQSPIS